MGWGKVEASMPMPKLAVFYPALQKQSSYALESFGPSGPKFCHWHSKKKKMKVQTSHSSTPQVKPPYALVQPEGGHSTSINQRLVHSHDLPSPGAAQTKVRAMTDGMGSWRGAAGRRIM